MASYADDAYDALSDTEDHPQQRRVHESKEGQQQQDDDDDDDDDEHSSLSSQENPDSGSDELAYDAVSSAAIGKSEMSSSLRGTSRSTRSTSVHSILIGQKGSDESFRDWNAEYQSLVERHFAEAERRKRVLASGTAPVVDDNGISFAGNPSIVEQHSISDAVAGDGRNCHSLPGAETEVEPGAGAATTAAAMARANTSSRNASSRPSDRKAVSPQSLEESSATAVPAEVWAEAEVERTTALRALANAFAREACEIGTTIVREMRLPAGSPQRQIPPVTQAVGGVAGGEKYVHRGIFFKASVDFRGIYGGDDENAAKAAQHELKGLMALISCRVRELCFPLCAVIRFRGFCLIAQSILPIDGARTLIYGSPDGGRTVVNLAQQPVPHAKHGDDSGGSGTSGCGDCRPASETHDGDDDIGGVGDIQGQNMAFAFSTATTSSHAESESSIRSKAHRFAKKMRIAARMLNIKEHQVRAAPIELQPATDLTGFSARVRENGSTPTTPLKIESSARSDVAATSAALSTSATAPAQVSLAAPADIEGHVGKDGRLYICDTARLFPPQLPRSSIRGGFLFNLLRPEFVKDLAHPLSPDAFSKFGQSDAKLHNSEVRAASDMLEGLVIPSFVDDLYIRLTQRAGGDFSTGHIPLAVSLATTSITDEISFDPSELSASSKAGYDCSDHTQLCAEMHSHGINLRFLLSIWRRLEERLMSGQHKNGKGEMAVVSTLPVYEQGGSRAVLEPPTAAESTAFSAVRRLQDVVLTEMCARACVRELRRRWREVLTASGVSFSGCADDAYERTTRHFLNIVFCSASRRTALDAPESCFLSWEESAVSTESCRLWQQILPEAIEKHFWGIPDDVNVGEGTDSSHDGRLRRGLTDIASKRLVHIIDGPALFVRICTLAGLSVTPLSVSSASVSVNSQFSKELPMEQSLEWSIGFEYAVRSLFTSTEPFGSLAGVSRQGFRIHDRPLVTHIHRISFEEGTALATLAASRAADGDRGAAYELYLRATTMFAETLATKPDDQRTLFNWGLCLQRLAALELSSGKPQCADLADRLFSEAGQKYRAAAPAGGSNVNPGGRDMTLLHKWALCLLEHAKMLERTIGSSRDSSLARRRVKHLVLEAGDKLMLAIQTAESFPTPNPLLADILYNFGVARLRLNESTKLRISDAVVDCSVCFLSQAAYGFCEAVKLTAPFPKKQFDSLLNWGVCEAKLANILHRTAEISADTHHVHVAMDAKRKLKSKESWRMSFQAYNQALELAELQSRRTSTMEWKRQVAEVQFNWANALYRLSKSQVRRATLAAEGQNNGRSAIANAQKTVDKCKRRYSRAVIAGREAGGAQRITVRNIERIAQYRIAACRRFTTALSEFSSYTPENRVDNFKDEGQLIIVDNLTDSLQHSASVMFIAGSLDSDDRVSSSDFFVLSRLPELSGAFERRTRPAPLLTVHRIAGFAEGYFVLRVFGRSVLDVPRTLNALRLGAQLGNSLADLPQYVFEEQNSVFVLNPLELLPAASLSHVHTSLLGADDIPESTLHAWIEYAGFRVATILEELVGSHSSLRASPHWDDDAICAIVERMDMHSFSTAISHHVENVVLVENLCISLSTTALCIPSHDGQQTVARRGYRFPELARRSAKLELNSAASWALGCILYELLVGCPPFLVCNHAGHGHSLATAKTRTHWSVSVTYGLCILERMSSGALWFPANSHGPISQLCMALLRPSQEERLSTTEARAQLAGLLSSRARRSDEAWSASAGSVQRVLLGLVDARDAILRACKAIARSESSNDRREPTPMLSEHGTSASVVPYVGDRQIATIEYGYAGGAGYSLLSLDTLQEGGGSLANATLWEPELADVMAGFSFVE